jgi:hypothetical protein
MVENKKTPDQKAADDQAKVDSGLVVAPAGTPAPVLPDEPAGADGPKKVGSVVDPRSGEKGQAKFAGFKGQHGFESEGSVLGTVPFVDPERIPADVTTAVMPDAGGDRLLAAAQAKAPSLTKEFVSAMGLSEADLGAIARGEVPPPPTPGPIHTADMYITPGGFQQTPPGISPGEADPDARRFGR